MAVMVEEFFDVSKAMEIAEAEFDRYGDGKAITIEYDGVPHLTVRGWWRIVQHEEQHIRALKRRINRLISGDLIQGDDVPYNNEEIKDNVR